jgi:hypothetical protein
VTGLPRERLALLRDRIERQRTTVEALKRDGHVYTDAERQLQQMIAELQAGENLPRAS